MQPELPKGVSLSRLRKNPTGYILKLNRADAIKTAKYLDFEYHENLVDKIPDEVYDLLKDHILEQWPKSKYAKSIGSKIVEKKATKKKSSVIEVKLPVPMASMDKIKPGNPGFYAFLDTGKSWVISDKLDGISLEVMYNDGIPSGAYTRGNGVMGQDVSGIIPALDIPKQIPIKQEFCVRLEFIIPHKHFDANFSKHKGTGEFKTARNLGGGLLKRNEPSAGVKSYRCVCYSIVKGKGFDQPKSKQLAILKQLKFRVVANLKHKGKLDEDTLVKLHNLRKKKSPYEIDGIIVEKDISSRPTKSNPKHAKAFKINSLENSMLVKVKFVEWRISRYGKIIPRIHIDPIILGGVEVRHFTGHNAYYIAHGFRYQDKAKKLPVRPLGVGATIRVIRSGDVIPYIMEVVKPARRPSVPDIPYVYDANGVHALAQDVKLDEGMAVKKLMHFFSVMEIEGLKTGVLTKLKAAGHDTVKKILDLSVADLLEIEGFKETSSKKLVANIQSGLKKATFAKTANASGVFGEKMGDRNMQKLIDHYPNILEMAKLPQQELADKIKEVAGFDRLSDQVAKGMPKFVKFLAKHGITLNKDAAASSNRLGNLSVLFTSVRDKQLQDDIKDQGGKIASSIKQANVLIVKDESASNKKIDQAIAEGIPVMTIDSFQRKYKL